MYYLTYTICLRSSHRQRPPSENVVCSEEIDVLDPIMRQPTDDAVVIRNMVQSDADLMGAMNVEAFEDKVEWAVGEKKLVMAFCDI